MTDADANDRAEVRERLVDAGHILESEGQGDYCMGHVSLRTQDDPGSIMMKASAMGLEEMTPANLITIDIEGEKTAGEHKRHNEVFIHSEIMRAPGHHVGRPYPRAVFGDFFLARHSD